MKKYLGMSFFVLLLVSCTSPEERFRQNQAKKMADKMRQKQIAGVKEIKQKIDQSFRNMTDPRAAVGKIRSFALQRLTDITDAEAKIVSEKMPVIGKKYDDSEYSFTWKHSGHKSIEVITSPPPCEPIAVYRVNRVFYH